MKKYYTDSDGGTILFGSPEYTFTVYNNYGDCSNTIRVFDNEEEALCWLSDNYASKYYRVCGFDFVTEITGKFNLYSYDCLQEDELKDKRYIKAVLNGRYFVYVGSNHFGLPVILLVKK